MGGVLIIGAGVAGRELAEVLKKEKQVDIEGFLDDTTNSSEVLGPLSSLDAVLQKNGISEVYFAIPSLEDRSKLLAMEKVLRRHKVPFRILPSSFDVINGAVQVKHTRSIEVEDLLGRPPQRKNLEHSKEFLKGKTILITGGAGSIGSEMFHQLVELGGCTVVALDNAEYGLFKLQYKHLGKENAHYVLADIKNKNRMKYVFEKYKPDVVFHAAAYKHVFQMEEHPSEAIDVNVFGTKNVLECAIQYNAESCVVISTDKAVNPKGIMGATKRVAELLMQHYARQQERTKMTAVRFGNVIGSSGSVVPLFKKQIEKGGPVTITHASAYRYFMIKDEAISLIISSLTLGKHKEIFVLDMGEPVKIMDLANRMIEMYNLRPGIDIPVEIIGLRDGEKLLEEVMVNPDDEKTAIEKILISREEEIKDMFLEKINELEGVYEKEVIIEKLRSLLDNFNHRKNGKAH